MQSPKKKKKIQGLLAATAAFPFLKRLPSLREGWFSMIFERI